MALTDAQRRQISENIGRLDYLNGTGVLSDKKKEMVQELFLIISAGGVGGKALKELKKTVLQQIDENAVKKQIMFMCVDTDYHELDEMVNNGDFSNEEILPIPFRGALDIINPERMSTTTREWVHPGLYDKTNAKAGYFDGSGASALRQCGRVMFAQAETQNRLYQRLQAIQSRAAAMSADGAKDLRLKVIFLAGLAGGTGSGTIIDLGFLTRHYLNKIMGPAWKANTSFSAYIFLPSACGSPIDPEGNTAGNRNAYAALKEIDYFMDLKSLKESFRMDYGTPATYNMTIEDNLFDFCTLVEGVGGGGVFFGDPADTARKITALSIMNILCANSSGTVDASGRSVFMVDSFLSNQDVKATAALSNQRDKVWPREANYHFCIIGYAACVVPVDLLTVYAFKKVFDRIYVEFMNHRQATPQMALTYLQNCGLDFKTVDKNYRTLTPDLVSQKLETVSAALFKQFGPYFMINLTKNAVGVINHPTEGYLAQAQQKMNGFMADKRKWQYIINLYNYLVQQLINKNNALYDIYTFVIDEMQKLLKQNAGILTESMELKNRFGYSFYWTPIDLTKGNSATRAVTQYLDHVMNPQRINMLAGNFVNQMYDRQDRWTALVPQDGRGTIDFNAADEIRSFIRNQMQDLVGKTLEDFIVMAYSGDPSATPSVMRNGIEVPSPATMTAANQILTRLSNSAVPLASVRTDFHLAGCYKNIYLTVPEQCGWLYQAILNMSATFGLQRENIYLSTANDNIVWSSLYAGVPAWALAWTPEAEKDYEVATPNAIGLHIEQGVSGRNWGELPNLYPEELWSSHERQIRGREAAISAGVRGNMSEARERGLLIPAPDLYLLTRFRPGETADSLWASLKMTENQRYTPAEMYRMLHEAGKAADIRVECVGFVTTDPDAMTAEQKDALAYDLSCRVVRKNSRERKELARTLEIARDLEARLEERNRGCVDLSTLVDFIDALKWDVITYEGYSGQWTINLETQLALGNRLSKKFEQQCAHFIGFGQYLNLDGMTRQQIRDMVARLQQGVNPSVFKAQYERTEVLKRSIYGLRTAKYPGDAPWAPDSPFAIAGNKSPWPMGKLDFPENARQQGYNGNDIRAFYQNFENLL